MTRRWRFSIEMPESSATSVTGNDGNIDPKCMNIPFRNPAEIDEMDRSPKKPQARPYSKFHFSNELRDTFVCHWSSWPVDESAVHSLMMVSACKVTTMHDFRSKDGYFGDASRD